MKKHKIGGVIPPFDNTFHSGEPLAKSGIMKIFLLQQEQLNEIRKALERHTEAIYQLSNMVRICLEKK